MIILYFTDSRPFRGIELVQDLGWTVLNADYVSPDELEVNVVVAQVEERSDSENERPSVGKKLQRSLKAWS